MIRDRLARLRRSADSGASAVEYALLTPIFLILAFLLIQAGLYFYARSIAQSFAEDASRAARGTQSTPADISDPLGAAMPTPDQLRTRAQLGLDQSKLDLDPRQDFVKNPQLDAVTLDADDRVTVVVTGKTVKLIPFLTIDIRAEATGPLEIFRQPGDN